MVWISSLVYLAGIDPNATHMSLCVFKWMGIAWCPGCGVGHSISYLLHGEWLSSWNAHWLGGLGLMVLLHRMMELLRIEISKYKLIVKSNSH